MRANLFSAAGTSAQAPSPTLVSVTESRPNEFGEPEHFIRKALRTINSNSAIGRKRNATALKAIGLVLAASLRAKAIGGWSTTGSYDPLGDFLDLQEAASKRLGPVREGNDPVALFRGVTAETVRVFLGVTAVQRMSRK